MTTLEILRNARSTGETIAAVDHLLGLGYERERAERACEPYEQPESEPVLTARITVIDDGTPSEYYPADEQAANGALDYSVEIVLARDGVQYQMIESSITLYADKINGGMSPCGTPIDGWCADPIYRWLRTLDKQSYRTAVSSLGDGPGVETIEWQLES